jgi:hypothetical protein
MDTAAATWVGGRGHHFGWAEVAAITTNGGGAVIAVGDIGPSILICEFTTENCECDCKVQIERRPFKKNVSDAGRDGTVTHS